MNTNYYLHSPDFPESMHIGGTWMLADGYEWTTDASDGRRWTDTATLRDYLWSLRSEGRAWVADEYGVTYTPGEMISEIIVPAAQAKESDHEFS